MLSLGIPVPAFAQIRPDRTLPNPSRVSQVGDRFVITRGTQLGENLFHSFTEFSIPRRGVATFEAIAPDVDTIIARVTGASLSNIDGLIEVLDENGDVSPADLFLINPNGIVFGPYASLNVGGSFVATTADALVFEDGTIFSATAPGETPLLTISTPIGLQFGENPGSIRHEAFSPAMEVPAGHTLALLGGEIRLPGGELVSESGRIALGSVLSGDRVGLSSDGLGWQFSYQAVQDFGNILLSELALLDVSGDSGGEIDLRGDRLIIDDSQVLAYTRDGAGRGIQIHASDLILQDFGLVSTSLFGSGQGGDLRVVATNSIQIQGGQVNSLNRLFPNGLKANVESDATGTGGGITVQTQSLRLWDGGQISADAFGDGTVGQIRIEAFQIDLSGVTVNAQGEPLLFTPPGGSAVTLPSAISSFTQTAGDAGRIDITTNTLSLQNGAVIQTSTQAAGNAGDVRIDAAESISISGTAPGINIPSGILTFSGGIPGVLFDDIGNPTATGDGGNLFLRAGTLTVGDRAVIALGSLNPTLEAGSTGNLQIRADSMALSDQGNVLSASNSGNGGDIQLMLRDVLALRQNSQLSTTAGLANAGGNGGNITIDSRYVAAVFAENSDITANAFTGNGGNIQIVTQGLFGIEPQPDLTNNSDITASSALGVDGEIIITSPDVDPSQDAVELPSNLVDATNLVAQRCRVEGSLAQSLGEFHITGRGGIPPAPQDLHSPETVFSAWVDMPNLPTESASDVLGADDASIPSPPPLVEAHQWIRGDRGELILMAENGAIAPLVSSVCASEITAVVPPDIPWVLP
jgi:filamentous hemagglutinin family protein